LTPKGIQPTTNFEPRSQDTIFIQPAGRITIGSDTTSISPIETPQTEMYHSENQVNAKATHRLPDPTKEGQYEAKVSDSTRTSLNLPSETSYYDYFVPASQDMTLFSAKEYPQTKLQPLGYYLPLTHASEESESFYAKLVIRGLREGGVSGWAKVVAGWAGGSFCSLWTQETDPKTASTLLTAIFSPLAGLSRAGNLGQIIHRLSQMKTIWDVSKASTDIGQAIGGIDFSGEELSKEERVAKAIGGSLSLLETFVENSGDLKKYGIGKKLSDSKKIAKKRINRLSKPGTAGLQQTYPWNWRIWPMSM